MPEPEDHACADEEAALLSAEQQLANFNGSELLEGIDPVEQLTFLQNQVRAARTALDQCRETHDGNRRKTDSGPLESGTPI